MKAFGCSVVQISGVNQNGPVFALVQEPGRFGGNGAGGGGRNAGETAVYKYIKI